MKKLLFDLVATQPNITGKRHGGGKYGEVVFIRMTERNIPFSCIYDSGLWLNPDIKDVCIQKGIPLYDCHTKNICDIIKKHGIERVYSALPARWVNNLPKECELYGTLHGMRGLETPMDQFFLKYKHPFRQRVKFFIERWLSSPWENYMRKRYRRLYFNSGLKLVTVSEHSRLAITSYFPEYRGELRCFYSPNTSGGGG